MLQMEKYKCNLEHSHTKQTDTPKNKNLKPKAQMTLFKHPGQGAPHLRPKELDK